MTALFWAFAVALVCSALLTITAKQPVHSVVGLLANFAAAAAMYISLSAEFIGAVQILVYSGAVLILFVFVIALLSGGVKPFDAGPNRLPRIAVPAGVVALFSFGCIAWAALRGTGEQHAAAVVSGPVGAADVFGSVSNFGEALFGPYMLPFEATALVLMVAVIGVVMLAGDASLASARVRGEPKVPRKREPIVKAKTP
jgi:NADH-quinone oxidoreductase subunit J